MTSYVMEYTPNFSPVISKCSFTTFTTDPRHFAHYIQTDTFASARIISDATNGPSPNNEMRVLAN